MKWHIETDQNGELIEVKPSKRDMLYNNKIVYAITIISKEIIDICAGIAGVCFLIPLTIILYIVKFICKDKGPLFYTQERIGKNGKLFKLYKYRTMVIGADEMLAEILKNDENAREEYSKIDTILSFPHEANIFSNG